MRRIVERYNRFMGHDLPPREYVIKFTVPNQVGHEKIPSLRHLYISKKNEGSPHHVIQCLKLFQANVHQLNRCTFGLSRRFSYTEHFVKMFFPIAIKQVRNYSADGGIPEKEERREILDLMIDIARQTADSYKVVFKTLYGAHNFRYARSIDVFDLSAFRILEMTKFEQRIRGLRYQILSEAAWLSVNIVFHVMAEEEKIDIPTVVLGTVFHERGDPEKQTMRDVYLALQMVAKFNILKWPTEWQFFLDGYCRTIGALVRLGEDNGTELNRNMSVSYCYDNRPTRGARMADDSSRGPASILYWENLNRRVTADFLDFVSEKGKGDKKSSKKFALLSYNEGLALVQLQLECVRTEAQQLTLDEKEGVACDMRIFIGFKGVYPLLHNIHYGAARQIGTRLVDLLAQRSAIFAEDHNSTADSVWQLQSQDSKTVKLKTQETQFTTGLHIGALAGYGFGNEGIQQPILGVISRIYRPSAKVVVVDIDKVGEYAEPVLVTSDISCLQKFDEYNDKIVYAILTKDPAGELRLLFPLHSQFRENERLVMKRVKGQQLISLGKIQSVTKAYLCYKLTVLEEVGV